MCEHGVGLGLRVLAPALVAPLGRLNWQQPALAARLLR